MRIHHVLRMPENVLLFGEARDLERGLHFFERGVPFVGRFRLIELITRLIKSFALKPILSENTRSEKAGFASFFPL